MKKLAQINHKAVRSLSKLMEAGFDSEKVVLNMTMDDIFILAGDHSGRNRDDQCNPESSKSRKDHHIFGRRGDMSSGKLICFTDSRGKPAFFTSGQFFFVSGVWERGQLLRILPLPQRGTGGNRRKVQKISVSLQSRWRRMGSGIGL